MCPTLPQCSPVDIRLHTSQDAWPHNADALSRLLHVVALISWKKSPGCSSRSVSVLDSLSCEIVAGPFRRKPPWTEINKIEAEALLQFGETVSECLSPSHVMRIMSMHWQRSLSLAINCTVACGDGNTASFSAPYISYISCACVFNSLKYYIACWKMCPERQLPPVCRAARSS